MISFYGILKCIGEFERTLVSMNSRFDAYLKGNTQSLNKEEINGYNLFAGKALCGSCHFFPLLNGLVPPVFNDTEFEVIGTPKDFRNKQLDLDSGRYKISKHNIHLFAFKTPTLRNIAITAPYMHNGCYKELDEVLDFYNKGGGAGLGFDIPHQTLPFDSLQLTKTELKNIKLFLLTLTDTSHSAGRPTRLPVIDDPLLNLRKIGGEY
jgi:cytochrome c peroxidase